MIINKTSEDIIRENLDLLDDIELFDLRKNVENIVEKIDIKYIFDTASLKVVFNIYNKLYNKNEVGLSCSSCRAKVFRGLQVIKITMDNYGR